MKFRDIKLTIDNESFVSFNPIDVEEIMLFTYETVILKIKGEIRKFKKDDYFYNHWTCFQNHLITLFDLG